MSLSILNNHVFCTINIVFSAWRLQLHSWLLVEYLLGFQIICKDFMFNLSNLHKLCKAYHLPCATKLFQERQYVGAQMKWFKNLMHVTVENSFLFELKFENHKQFSN